MGGGTPRANAQIAPHPDHPHRAHPRHSYPPPPSIPAPPSRHSCRPLPVIPAQAGTRARRGQLAAPTTQPTPTPSPIHPSPPSRGEARGGWNAASRHRQLRRPPPSLLRPLPVIPAPLPVIPAQAGTRARRGQLAAPTTQPTPAPPPIHPSPLPGGRLGGGWNAASQHRQLRRPPPSLLPSTPQHSYAPSVTPTPPQHSYAPSVIPAQAGTRSHLARTPL